MFFAADIKRPAGAPGRSAILSRGWELGGRTLNPIDAVGSNRFSSARPGARVVKFTDRVDSKAIGDEPRWKSVAKIIDHTNLRPEATPSQIIRLCDEAKI